LESTAEGFQRDRVPNHAAAMTYYGVFSLFPLLLLFTSLAGLALQSNEAARQQILGVVTGLLPQGQDQLRKVIGDVIEAKGAAAGIGTLALLWGALGWFQVIDTNINEVWGVSKPRSFVKGKLFALAMVASIGGVALASFAATAAVKLCVEITGGIPGSVVLWQAAISLLSVLTIAAAFYVLYRYAPQRRIEFADVWPAALATAVLWEATRRALAFYLEKNDMISGYGPIGAAMALLFWIYVASIIILVGAELTYAIAKERRHIPADDEMRVVSPPGEQPTPKFAPQVGEGATTKQDEREPIERPAAAAAGPGGAGGRRGQMRHRHAPAGGTPPSSVSGRSDSARQPYGTNGAAIRLDLPLAAVLGLAFGYILGRIRASSES
jgi:membrane protein